MTDAQAVVETSARRKLKCPRCGRVAFVDRHAGGVGARCPSCGGVHLSAADVEQVISLELGLTTGELRERATRASDVDLGGCSSCRGPLSRADIDDVKVELCLRCGAGWLDPGELERLSHGRHLERRPPGEGARQHLPHAVKQQGRRGKVSLPPARNAYGPIGTALLGATVAGAWFGQQLGWIVISVLGAATLGGIAAIASVVYLLARARVTIDLDEGTMRSVNVGGPSAAQTTKLADVRAIAVEPARRKNAQGRSVQYWDIVPKGDGVEGRLLLMYTSRLRAHRVAFQLSQVLEVPVETPRDV